MPDETLTEQALAERRSRAIGILPYVAAVSGQVADGISTLHAFKHGAVEQNPLIGQSPGMLMGVKAAGAVGIPLLMKKIADSGHPKIAKALGYALGGAGALVAGHNYRVATKGR